MRYDFITASWVNGPMVHKRIERLMRRLSRDRTLTEADAMAAAYQAAHAWASTAAQAALALRRSGFVHAPAANWGFRCGLWLGAGAPLAYEKAEREARLEGRQFVRDFRAEQFKRVLRAHEQATTLVADIRRMERQLSKKEPTT